MSDSSDEGEPFRLRDYNEDSDEDSLRPNKRRKTQGFSTLRSRGLAFVQNSRPDEDEASDEENARQHDEEDIDDARPTMGGFRNGFNIGEYPGFAPPRSPSPQARQSPQPEKTAGTGPSAFSAGGKMNKNSFAARMMAKMGHVEGQGLGRAGQGISAPIQAQKQQVGTGLGFGKEAERPKKPKRQEKDINSRLSTPGASTPRLKAPPKKKYEVAAVESRGLHVPDSMKNIIDATGAENRTISLSGYSTPTSEVGRPITEEDKKQILIKKQLQQYAEAWDGQIDRVKALEQESSNRQEEVHAYENQTEIFREMVASFERVAVDDSAQPRSFDSVIERLQGIQDSFSSYIEALDLPELCASTLDRSFQAALLEWDPLADPGAQFVSSLQSIGALLELEKTTGSHHRKKTTYLESLLLKTWYPKVRDSLRTDWDIYDPIPAVKLFETWTETIIPPWMSYKLLQEIILPKLLEAVRKFKKRRSNIPDIHEWVFDWWTIFTTWDIESFHQLKVDVKTKVRFDEKVWPVWKDLLGTQKPVQMPSSQPRQPTNTSSGPGTPTIFDEHALSFKDLLEEWCTENDLMLRNTGSSDELGRRLYRLQVAEKRTGGILVYMQDDVVFEASTGDPYGLDERLVARTRGSK